MDVSNRTYHIKENPYFVDGERIIGNFTSANHQFHEISIDEYDGDLEIWYLDRNNPDGSVLAYANGTWEVEYRFITFGSNVQLSDSDFVALNWAYDEYIEPRRLRFIYQGTILPGTINDRVRGSISYQGVAYPFDNRAKWATPTIQLDNSTLSTPIVDGVTKYKVYSNGSYIGYVDSDNVWHGEVMDNG